MKTKAQREAQRIYDLNRTSQRITVRLSRQEYNWLKRRSFPNEGLSTVLKRLAGVSKHMQGKNEFYKAIMNMEKSLSYELHKQEYTRDLRNRIDQFDSESYQQMINALERMKNLILEAWNQDMEYIAKHS